MCMFTIQRLQMPDVLYIYIVIEATDYIDFAEDEDEHTLVYRRLISRSESINLWSDNEFTDRFLKGYRGTFKALRCQSARRQTTRAKIPTDLIALDSILWNRSGRNAWIIHTNPESTSPKPRYAHPT